MSLTVERVFGSYGNIQVGYKTVSGTALPGSDYTETTDSAVTMDAKQTQTTIKISVIQVMNTKNALRFHKTITIFG